MANRTAAIALLCAASAAAVEQKDVNMLSFASTISSNMGLLMLNKE